MQPSMSDNTFKLSWPNGEVQILQLDPVKPKKGKK